MTAPKSTPPAAVRRAVDDGAHGPIATGSKSTSQTTAPAAPRRGLCRRLCTRRAFTLLGVFVLGILCWGAFNTALEWTNQESFCLSCHEMRANNYQEYRETVHYQNRSGVTATCPDCHVPKEWGPKILRKIQASNELWHHLMGSVDTPEKFNAQRAQLANSEWARMKRNDSQECRNCHHFKSMDFAEQNTRSSREHQMGIDKHMTCIDCHKGIAHTLPPIEQHIGAPKANPADFVSDQPEASQPAN